MVKTLFFVGYLIIYTLFFSVWFYKFWTDSTTPKNDRISWIALAIGPLFWPLILPFVFWELTSKKRQTQPTESDGKNQENLEEAECNGSLDSATTSSQLK